MNMAFIVFVMGFSTAQASLLSIAADASFNSGV
jgi:hypothetical protein